MQHRVSKDRGSIRFCGRCRRKCDPLAKPALGQRSLERIGNTPLLRLARIASDLPGVEILGKAEWLNPGGSVKDRAAANIVAQARRERQVNIR